MNKHYQIEKCDGYVVINLQGDLDFRDYKSFEEEISGISNNANAHVLVNCEHLVSLSKDWVRVLLKLQINLKTNDKFLKLVHLSQAVLSHLKKEGIDSTFKIAGSIREALQETGQAPKRTLDTAFIDPFLLATIHVLKVQASVEVKAGQIYMKKSNDKLSGDVSGIIGIVSESFNGSVVISFPETTFLKVISGMLGEEYTKLDKEILDGAGELTNMIFGQAKVVLNEKGYGINTAIPSVVSGKDHTLTALTKGPIVVVPFTSTAGNFFVEICLSS